MGGATARGLRWSGAALTYVALACAGLSVSAEPDPRLAPAISASATFSATSAVREPRLVPTPIEIKRLSDPVAAAQTGPRSRFKTKARNAIILDPEQSKPLFELNADQPMPPASMTKLMTFLVAMQTVSDGEVSMASRFWVGDRAASRPGSSMRLRKGDRPTVKQLLFGAMVVSGNDAATALAQGIAGSEKAFVRLMNRAAKGLGLTKSRFRNPTGFTAKGHYMSARDLAQLAEHLVTVYPDATAFFTRRSFKWGGVAQRNRNPLLFADLSDIGVVVEGMKTGFTRAAGYCAVVSAVQRRKGAPPRRVIAVLAGLPSDRARAREAERAIRWAFDDGSVASSAPTLRPRPVLFRPPPTAKR